jgi:putative SOS response-associated peptidase YedK
MDVFLVATVGIRTQTHIAQPVGTGRTARHKFKPVSGPHLVYSFLTTTPNAVVEPIHPKAMPVILATDKERGCAITPPEFA